MKHEILFTEKLYLGREPLNQSIRLVIALVCFALYYYSDGEDATALLPLVGSSIVLVSVVMMYVVHYRISVTPNSITMDGLWTSKVVKVDFTSISQAEVIRYSKYLISSPVYNLHRKGKIRFYASGKYGVQLTDKTGLVYIIGTHRPEELCATIKKQLHG